MLCSKCQEIFSDDRVRSLNEDGEFGEWYVHHNIGSLLPTLQNPGCHLCVILVQQYRYVYKEGQARVAVGQDSWGWEHNPQIEYEVGPFDSVNGLQLIFRLASSTTDGEESLDRQETSIPFYHRVFRVVPAEMMRENLHLAGSDYQCVSGFTGDKTCWSLFHQWLQQCEVNHKFCRLRADPETWYPTRLLHIEGDWPADPWNHTVRLHITAEEETAGSYMTLSHCWGGAVPVILTVKTMESLKTGITVRDLPNTFAEAVFITASCGVRYLWIDSLCIIQGSEDDWRNEASQMGHIYSNSLCNIAATGSSNSSGGCFQHRDPMVVRPVAINATWISNAADSESPAPGEYACVDADYWIWGVDRAPLGKRAWAVQERCLAPRQLHLGAEQLFWECREHVACETFPGSAPDWGHTMPTKNFAADIEELIRFVEGGNDDSVLSGRSCETRLEDIYKGWDRLVDCYSRCALTFGRDKLVAISGLAVKMQQAIGDEYLAGLWKNHLPSQLLWRTTGPVRRNGQYAIRPRPLRAPTWSWASVEADINSMALARTLQIMKAMVRIINASVTSVSGDRLGEVEGGFLRLRGMLCRATVHEDSAHEQKQTILRIDSTEIGGNVLLDEAPQAMGTRPSNSLEDLSLHCLPVLSAQSQTEGEIFWIFGLLLRPIENAEGEYERFGYFDTRSRRGLAVLQRACDHVDIADEHGDIITIR